MIECYAIIPDHTREPAALFGALEDAVDWALGRFGNDRFSIRMMLVAPVERAESHGSPGPV